ncbi:MAG: acetate kinase [Bacteroidetes bacterium CG2_30_33_31]|nr:MAG: acetate kinase [Bacteroidetes bacterium CG2_30_33_31]
MKILVLNCGSSSIKYQLFDIENSETLLAKGIVEKIGLLGSFIKNSRLDGDEVKLVGDIFDHQQGIEYVLGVLTSKKHGSIQSIDELKAVGHRVVHGGEAFKGSVFINDEVINTMEECVDLAPLHNPPNLKGIYAIKELLPNVPQGGVFDTAFHQTMEAATYMYAIPYSLYKKYGIRKYGFHGTSHRYVSDRAAKMLNRDIKDLKIISCHLGNGASIAAIKNGKSIDTSMGLTPVEGLMMGTRSGDLDAGALTYIMQKEEIGLSATNTLINKHSGMLGISGVSSDLREVEAAAADGNARAQLSLQMYNNRIVKYIGAYIAEMGGLDALIFTGGIGENANNLRSDILKNFGYMGLILDEKLNNELKAKEAIISTKESAVAVLVIPTNEELVIARDTYLIVKDMVK